MTTTDKRAIVVREGRLSYAHIFKMQEAKDAEGKASYNTSVLIPKTNKKDIDAINAAVEAARKKGVDDYGAKWRPARLPLRDGDVEKPDNPEYAGHYFFNCKTQRRPGVVDRNLQPILDESQVYSGCWCMVAVTAFPYKHEKGGNGIAFSLESIMKLRDDEPFGAEGRSPESYFADAIAQLSEDDDLL